VLDGQGADEILLGYFSFYPFYLRRKLYNPLNFLREFARGADTSGLGINKFLQNYLYFNFSGLRFKYVQSNANKFLRKGYVHFRNRRELFDRLISGSLSENRFSNLWNISLQSLLRYEDKNSMAYSVEARLPFLDHRLVELIFRIPYDELIKDGWTKYALRQSMKNRIPENIRMRKGKLAFSVPQKLWLKEIKGYIKDSLTSGVKAIKYIDINKTVSEINSKKYNDKILFRVFALEKWMEVFDLK
jgi:asparagine synthase (glutamine-hydrolysing)